MAQELADKFSGDWRDYIEVRGFGPKDGQLISETLDRMAVQVPEFQELLCSSQQPYCTYDQDGKPRSNQKVIVEPTYASPFNRWFKASPGFASFEGRVVGLDPAMLNTVNKIDAEGRKTRLSLERVIFHEFVHIADPQCIETHRLQDEKREEIRASIDQKYQKIDRFMSSLPSFMAPFKESWQETKDDFVREKLRYESRKIRIEQLEEYAVNRTNAVMHRHYGESFRNGYLEGTGKNWLHVMLPERDPVTHSSTEHDSSFIPLPIADAVDPDRLKLATALAHNINAKIDDRQSEEIISSPTLSLAEVSQGKGR